MNSLIRKLVKAVGVKWLTGQVRAAAEGKLGPQAKAVYWWLAGRKREISTWAGVAAGAAFMVGYPGIAGGIGAVAAVGLSLGFIDANWRDDSEYDWLKDSAVWKAVANNAPLLTAGATAGLAWLQGTTCTLGDWCARASIGLVVAMAVLVQVGAVDAAWNAPAPKTDD